MKLNFKTILIIFLVSMFGASIGCFGLNEILKINSKPSVNVEVSKVQYEKMEKSDYSKAIDKAIDCVVEITAEVQTATNYFFYSSYTSTAAGSGVIISEDGYIVTNEHVVSGVTGEDPVHVKLYNGDVYSAEIIGSDTRSDIAVLKIDAKGLKHSDFADSDQLFLGQEAIVIGNPLGSGISCSNGIVSALEKEIYVNNVYMSVIQTNAAVNEGNSGGGLFDINGNIIGIVNAKRSSSTSSTIVEGIGYAIPSNKALEIITEIIENGYVKDRAALGIKVYTSGNYYTNVSGLVISEVIEGGAADKAGIKAFDIITAINDDTVTSYGDLSKILDKYKIGDEVTVTIVRENKQKTFKVKLQETTN